MRAETRHQLKQDRFNKVTIGVAEATADWSAEHKGTLLIAGAIVLLIVGVAVGGWYYNSQRNDQASLEMEQAVRTLETPVRPAGTPAQAEFPTFASENERASIAHKEFQSIVDQYPHTHSGDFARYFLAVTDASMGNNAAAEKGFKEVASLHDKDAASLAKFALASLYRDTNRTKDAIDVYKGLIEKPTDAVGKATAQMALADTYQAAGQSPEAKRILEQVQKDNPASEVSQLASQKLAALK
ncbi:MAG: tetratricopeptide repeat protein [Terriglobales bacterium]